MGLTRFAFARPITIIMIFVALIIFGAVSYGRLNSQKLPEIDIPAVTVTIIYPGALPGDVDQLVTREVEDAIGELGNIDYIKSVSREGFSQVIVVFLQGIDASLATADVNNKVAGIRDRLPSGIGEPSILKLDPNTQPSVILGVQTNLPPEEAFELVRDTVKPRLQVLQGVGAVNILGGYEREIQVRFDPYKVRAYDLTVQQVQQALANQNIDAPGGTAERGRQQLNLRTSGMYPTAEAMGDLPVASTPSGTIRLRNIAEVVDTHKQVWTRAYVDGVEGIGLSISRQVGGNDIKVADAVIAETELLNKDLPPGTQLILIRDDTTMTRISLAGVQSALIASVIMVSLIIMIFLHTPRAIPIILIAVPTCMIASYSGMLSMNFTRNIMTSMALVLVIGVLVDSSTTVIEAMVRHLADGKNPVQAAIDGRAELGVAAIASAMMYVSVFTPVAFMSETVGQIFREFGMVVVSTVLISAMVAFTLTPLAGSKVMKRVDLGNNPWGAFSRGFDRGFDWLKARYITILGWCLSHRWLPPLLMFLALAYVVQLPGMGVIKNEFLPDLDDGAIRVNVEMPPGTSLEATDAALRAIEARIKDIPEIEHMIAISGTEKDSNDRDWSTGGTARFGVITVSLVDVRNRQRNTKAVAQDIRERLPKLADADLRVGTGKPGLAPVEVRVRGANDATVFALADRVLGMVRDTPGAVDARTSQAPGSPETRLVPDRLRGPNSGVTADVAAAVLRTTLEGSVATKWRGVGEREVDVRLIGDPALTGDPRALSVVPVGGMLNGKPVTVSLNQVTTQEDASGPSALDRYNRVRSVYIRANLAYGVFLSEVITPITADLEKLRADGAVPTGHSVEFGGSAESQAKNFVQIKFAFTLAIILVYMVLASLFESLILPLTVLFTVPSALIGALTGLALTGQTLNLLSLIGLVVLIALVGDNGSMLVEYTQDLRREGLERRAALLKSGPVRMRPIVMTTLGTIVGTLPLALGTQPGSEMYQSLGVEMVFGMGFSLFMTLLIIPCMYTYFDDLQTLIGRVFKWRPSSKMLGPLSGRLPPRLRKRLARGPVTVTAPVGAAGEPSTGA